jgi:ribose transport system substrate-binding protein
MLVADAAPGAPQEALLGFRSGVDRIGGVAHTEGESPLGDNKRQLALLGQLAGAHRAGLTVSTQTPELVADVLARTAAAGVPLTAVGTPPATGSAVALLVGNDNYALGRSMAEEVVWRLPPAAHGLVVLGTSVPGDPALDQRVEGIREGLGRLRPDLRVLGPFDTKQDPAANRDSWGTLVTANPSAVAFVGAGDADSASLAAVKAGAAQGWIGGAFGDDRPSLLAAKAGLLAVVSPETFLQGAVAGMLQAVHARTGMPLPRGWIVTPGLVVTPGNVDQLLARQTSVAGRARWFDEHLREIMANPSAFLRPLPLT